MTTRLTSVMTVLLSACCGRWGREAGGWHGRAAPFGRSCDAVGQCVHGVLAPGAETHRVQAEAEHGDPVLECLTAVGRGRGEHRAADHRYPVLLGGGENSPVGVGCLLASDHGGSFAPREPHAPLAE